MLKIGFVSVVRPLFKGESQRAAERSLERLKDLGEELCFEVVHAFGVGERFRDLSKSGGRTF